MATTAAQTCYRHPNRETGVSCSSCGRPICPSCMTPTPVGMRCPECSRQRTEVRTINTISRGSTTATITLIAINAIAFLASGAFGIGSAPNTTIFDDGALFAPSIAIDHEYYRLVTGGFLHAGLLHIGFNMYLLWILGQMLEPSLGTRRFVTLYAVSLLAGSFGALAISGLFSQTVGASGAVFGLMGVAFFEMRHRGIDPMASGIGPLIVINLIFSFVLSNISIGGHIGGLVGGSLAALAFQYGDRMRRPALGYAAAVAIAALAVGGAISVSSSRCDNDARCAAVKQLKEQQGAAQAPAPSSRS